MSALAGTRPLLRLALRLDRVRLTAWVLALGLIPSAVASSFASLYGTEAARAELVRTVASSPALVALLGPVSGTSVGALTAWRIGTIGSVLIAFMAAFTVIRHTRQEEETGRHELLGATAIGRHAQLIAAGLSAALAGGAIALLMVGGLAALGEAATGALAFAAAWLLIALAFAAVGALSAQLTESAGVARALAGSVIGLAFVLRMAGDGGADSGFGWLSWLSPIGWTSQLRPFGHERWWVAGLLVAFTLVVALAAFALSTRRDVGAGVFQPRPGPADAPAALRSPLGLARRLRQRALVGWLIGVAVFAAIWGVLADTVSKLLEDNPQLARIFESLGRSDTFLTDIFFSAAFGMLGLMVSAYAISSTLALRTEEDELRAEPVLATPTPRLAWAASHLAFVFVGPILLVLVGAVSASISYGLIIGDIGGTIGGLLQTALLHLPPIWVTAAVAVALYGLAPRLTSLSWGVLVTFLLLGQLGQILRLPQWALDLSPFTHVPVPPDPVTVRPIASLLLLAGAGVAAGLVGLRRRDIS